MLWRRIAAGGFGFLAASVVNASAQSCLLPWACQESRSSAEKVRPKVTDANSAHVKNNLSSQKGSLRIVGSDARMLSTADSRKMLDQEKEEPLFKDLRHGQRQENQSSTPTDQAFRDALFDEFLRWQVHEVMVGSESSR